MPNGLTYTRMGWTLNKRNVIYCRHEKKKICTYKKTKVNINNWYKYKFVVVILCADVFSVGLAFSLPHRRQRVVICYNRIWFVGWMRNIEGRARLAGDDNIWIHSTSPFFTLSLSLCEAFFVKSSYHFSLLVRIKHMLNCTCTHWLKIADGIAYIMSAVKKETRNDETVIKHLKHGLFYLETIIVYCYFNHLTSPDFECLKCATAPSFHLNCDCILFSAEIWI